MMQKNDLWKYWQIRCAGKGEGVLLTSGQIWPYCFRIDAIMRTFEGKVTRFIVFLQ